MKYIYNVKNRTIREYREGAEEIDLSRIESRLVEILSNNDINSWKEIADYIYGYHGKYTTDCVRQIKSRLLKKVKLKIKNFHTYGLELKDEIYIEKERNDKNMGMAALGLTHCSKHGTPLNDGFECPDCEFEEKIKKSSISKDNIITSGFIQTGAPQGWQCPVCR